MTDAVERFLKSLHHPVLAGIDLSLDRMLRLLAMLGNPHKRLPPVIHVAGTNGKGSLLIYLHSILEAAGYRVHRYNSPHLVHFRERIILQGKEIDDSYLEKILGHVAGQLRVQPATFFEATTAAAFLAFAERPADVLLLETGMGGRLDATNVVPNPIATAITPIAMDHTEYLGNSIAEIAGEKAGIIKRGAPLIVGRQEAAAAEVIARKAAQLGAPLSRLGQEWDVVDGQYRSPTRRVALNPSLAGAHQLDNAASAIAVLEALPQFTVTDEHIAKGLSSAVWPARLQKLEGSIQRSLPEGIELWLDGGHNPQGGEILGRWLAAQGKEVHLICGMINGKDTKRFLAPVAAHAASLTAITIPDESNSQPAEAVARAARGLGMKAGTADSIEKALQSAASHAKTPSIICICGSLYLAGRILAANKG